jgi:hypothetical protein
MIRGGPIFSVSEVVDDDVDEENIYDVYELS